MTLIVNLFGGPGTGKSTVAAGVFHELKKLGKSAECVHEFAKDLTWEDRQRTLQFQPYVIGKQMYRIWRLIDQVDVIITDSPIMLGFYYADPESTPMSFYDMVFDYHHSWNNLDILLKRDPKHLYDTAGRNQTEEEALKADEAIQTILDDQEVAYRRLWVNHTTVGCVVQLIHDKMNWEY